MAGRGPWSVRFPAAHLPGDRSQPQARNLVLSRRAVLEREKEEAKKNFFESLQPGQVHQGVVRKLLDFGAFVELGGGVDGLLHVSQLSWGRVNHPSDVLSEGQTIQVKIEKVDRESGRIGLSYRDMLENPWNTAAAKYPPNGVVRGKVTKLMEFGAFVELEPGVEGLIHISELSHKRVWRASDVVHEGDELEVLVLAVNSESQRISLSIKALTRPEPAKTGKGGVRARRAGPDLAEAAATVQRAVARRPGPPLWRALRAKVVTGQTASGFAVFPGPVHLKEKTGRLRHQWGAAALSAFQRGTSDADKNVGMPSCAPQSGQQTGANSPACFADSLLCRHSSQFALHTQGPLYHKLLQSIRRL